MKGDMMSKLLAVMAVGAVTTAMLLAHPEGSAVASADYDGSSYLHVDDRTGLPITEDDPRWSCVDDGNRVCGPDNDEGKTPACYDDGGVIVALWPCHVVVNPDGSSDVYEGLS